MQNRVRCAVALCVGTLIFSCALGVVVWSGFTPGVVERSAASVEPRAVQVVVPANAEVVQSMVGRMLVADTARRLGEERTREIARRFEADCEQPNIPVPQLCFAPGTPDDVIATYNATIAPRFFQIDRWSITATNGPTGNEGDPITLTYSFPPDGTTIPDIGIGFPAGISNFRARMNALYGSQAVWQPIFEQVFARWSEVAGVTYVFEPNDDGVSTNVSPGVLGVRGDLRICGMFLDGNSNVLAYNNFPDDGDMVIDTADNFFNDTSNNSLRLRNIAAHEHGHGLGELHVCPLDEIKLMEPIATTAFDGPQHDDIRNAQGHYGDPNEPDNSPGQATDIGMLAIPSSQTLGTLGPPAISFGSTLSIDANGEQDYFRFSVASPGAVSVTVAPIGTNYEDAPQNCQFGSAYCCSGTFTNSLAIANLAIQVVDSNGLTVLGAASSNPAGSSEVLSDVILDSAGDYYIRVYETNTPAQPQLYRLSVSMDSVPFLPLSILLPGGAPAEILPGQATTFDVEIDTNDESLVGGSAQLRYRFDGGAFISAPLAAMGGNLYEATLPPASCTDTPEFYVEAVGTVSGVITQPSGGAASPLTALVGTATVTYDDNGETNPGWTVSGDAGDGQWDRGVPLNNDRGDPTSDFDGSGQCWLTDNDPDTTNSDVDNGSTILTSPVIDVSSLNGAKIAYARWFDNTYGSNPGEATDTMVVEVSDNGGGTWTMLETVGPTGAESSGGWFEVEYTISDFVSLTSQFRIRFTATDLTNGSVVEAGIDAIRVSGVDCDTGVTAPGAPTGVSATDGVSCDDVLVTWDAAATADQYDVYRNGIDDSGTATLIAPGVMATSYSDTGAAAGATLYYWVQACNTAGCSGFSASDSGSRLDVAGDVSGVVATNEDVCGAVDLAWDALAGATQYHVYRNSVSDFGTAVELGVVSSAETSFRDASADAGVTYFYWIVADNTCGSGGEGTPVEGVAGLRGDFNLDGLIDGQDIHGMVQAYLGDSSLAPCADLAVPAGVVDSDDVTAFVGLLVAP